MLAGKQPYDDRGDHASLRANLTIMPPVHGIESVGAIEAINSMLLQSHGGTIRVFPNWPKGRTASFQNLRAEGAFLVSAATERGTIGPIDVVSEVGGHCRVVIPWPDGAASVCEVDTPGAPLPAFIADGRIGFDTVRGKRYRIYPANAATRK